MYEDGPTAPAGGAGGGSTGGATGGGSTGSTSPTAGYHVPWANAYFSGITDEQGGANSAANHVVGHSTGVALYEGTSPTGVGNPNTADSDMENDLVAVTQFARASESVQLDKNGHLVIDPRQYGAGIQIGGPNGEQYASPDSIGNRGADTAVQSNPDLALAMQNGQDPRTSPELANQFISLTGHSGGGQSSFYSAIELYQRGFRNISVVGYDMAISPHEREVMEQLGIPVTNITGHAGDKDNYVNSSIGEGIRLGMGGDLNYYDASVDRGGDPTNFTGQHDVAGNDQVTTMLRYSSWLDSQHMHQQWSDSNYQAFLAATQGTGNDIANDDGTQHDSVSPMGGSFVDYHQRHDDIYLQTPQINGNELIAGLTAVNPLLGAGVGWLGNSLTPNFGDTQMPQLDIGANPNLDVQGGIDLSQGEAHGSVGLGGSTVDVGGIHATVPDWVNVGGGVNLSQGEVSGNFLGVGGDINLSQGNVDLNLFGNTIDVDQGVRDLGNGISNGVSAIGNGIGDGLSSVGHFFGL
jgi:hypothetical protein